MVPDWEKKETILRGQRLVEWYIDEEPLKSLGAHEGL